VALSEVEDEENLLAKEMIVKSFQIIIAFLSN
jgi:hypothetical protein